MNPYTHTHLAIDRSRDILLHELFSFSSRNKICSFEHCSIVLICSICLEHRVYLFSSLLCEDNGHGMCLYVSSFFHTFTLISEEKLDNYKTPFDLAFDHSIASQLSIKHRISSLHFTLTFTDDDDDH